jgi:hypothetical protein
LSSEIIIDERLAFHTSCNAQFTFKNSSHSFSQLVKIGELERLGVTTHTRVQDDSKWNNAISMGFFQNIEDAQAFLAELRSKGVRSAIIGARNLERTKFVITEPPQRVVDKMVELKEEFPHTELETLKCENPNNKV